MCSQTHRGTGWRGGYRRQAFAIASPLRHNGDLYLRPEGMVAVLGDSSSISTTAHLSPLTLTSLLCLSLLLSLRQPL
ncbi:unnamed protein product [Boreogadus saida]